MKIIFISFAVILLFLFLLLLILSKMQEKLIFFPEKLSLDYQFTFEGRFEEVNFNTETNVVLNALHFRADSSRGLVLYFHGNAGALNTWGDVAKDFLPHHYDILIVDFRGYGKSTGKITHENQLHQDAEFIYAEMCRQYAKDKIIIYGRSLGSGMASRLAASHPPKALILETPFYSLTDLVKKLYPFLPVSQILKYHFDNASCIQKLECPVFLIHGTKDEVVPYSSSTRLAALGKHVKLFTLNGGTHNNLSDFPEFHSALKNIFH